MIPQILSYHNLPLYLLILKISCVNLEWLKSFNFGVLVWKGPSSLVPPNFVKIHIFFYLYLF